MGGRRSQQSRSCLAACDDAEATGAAVGQPSRPGGLRPASARFGDPRRRRPSSPDRPAPSCDTGSVPRWWIRAWRRGTGSAIWALNSAEWVVALLGLLTAGGVLVPVNTRFKGPEAAEMLCRSGARVLVTVTDFLGTDYVSMLQRREQPTQRSGRPSSWPAGNAPDRRRGMAHLPRPSDRRRPGRGRPAPAGARPARTPRTSCSPPARRACPRAS